jgi:hypothetical protein
MQNRIIGKPEVNAILGKSTNEAGKMLEQHGYTLRVVNNNGTPLMSTTDFNDKRVNVFVENGIVSDIKDIG